MGISRIVNTDLWNDPTIIDNYSPEDKYFWLYLLTNPQTKQLGIYKLPKKIIAFQMGYSLDTVITLLERFENSYKTILYSNKTQEVAILNYLKYSIVKGGKPVIDCVKKDISQVKNELLLSKVYHNLVDGKDKRETILAIIKMLSVYDNDNDNDNDNDSIVPRIVPRIVKSQNNKNVYGEFSNVKLTDEEYEKLHNEFGNEKELIEFLSVYKADKPYKNKSDYLSIRRWVVDAVKKKKPIKEKSNNPFLDKLREEEELEQKRSDATNGLSESDLPKLL